MNDIDEIKYDWEVLEIRSDDDPGQNGALVRYTPEWEECSILEQFVPVPFHKCKNKEHAREILEKKITARAPRATWQKELAKDESGDTKTIGDEIAAELGVSNEPAVNSPGSAQRDPVPQPSGSKGVGSGADGDAQDEAGRDHTSKPATGAAGPRIRKPRR